MSGSANGRFVIFGSERGRRQDIYRKPWDGSGPEERLTESDHTQYPRSASPDGKSVAFVQDGDIWLLALDGSGKTTPLFTTPFVEDAPAFSPDGKYIAYQTNESGRDEINIVPYPVRGGKWQVSSGGGTNPIWSPSGSELYFTKGDAIYSVAIHAGSGFDYSAPVKVLTLPADGAFITGVSKDNKQFALVTIPVTELSTSEFTLVTNWFQELRNAFVK